MPTTIRATGIPWYAREDYPRILAVMEDAQKLHTRWEDWFKAAKQLRDRLRAQGYLVVEAHIDPDTFPDWCRANGHNVDAKGRSAFANRAAYEKFRITN